MKEISISKFKATCLAVLETVRKTRSPVRVTRFGVPVAEVVPPTPRPAQKRVLGSLEGSATVVGDIVHANPWIDSERKGRGKKK